MENWKEVGLGLVILGGAGTIGYFIYKRLKEEAERKRLMEEFHRLGDVNRDGVIDDTDLLCLKNAYGSKPSDPNWNPDCDLNGDGKVDIYDVVIASSHYGLTFEEWLKTRG